MTPPPARLVALYLSSRQTRTILILLAATAAVLRASQPVTKDSGVFPELTLMLLTLAGAAVTAAATRNPFGEAEHTASSPLPALRLTHLLTAPLGYVMYCGAELDAQTYRPWTWPILPAGNHAAAALAVGLLAAGIAAATIAGARSRPGDTSLPEGKPSGKPRGRSCRLPRPLPTVVPPAGGRCGPPTSRGVGGSMSNASGARRAGGAPLRTIRGMETVIALDRATKRFGGLTAVDGLSLEIGRGSTVALLGANGAGKSTTVGMLMGLVQPDAGRVTVAGRTPRQAVVAGRIAAMLQDSGLMPGVTAGELVGLAGRMYPAPLPVAEALELAGLRELARRRVERLSGGQAQRLKFALVAVAGAETMLLDEPTRALDVQGRREFWTAIRNCAAAGRTILFATHYLDEVEENADRVVVLARGRVAADGDPARIREAGGGAVVRFRHPPNEALPPLPGEVGHEHGWTTVRTSVPDDVVRRLAASDVAWRDLRVSPPSLEESFLALTSAGRPLTEEAQAR